MYMSLTVHFIENWELRSKCLQVLYTPQDHTSENLKYALQESMECWSLDPLKLTAFTTDNGSKIVKACQLAGFLRFQCFGHSLNLAVTNSIKDGHRVSRAVGVCRKLTIHFANNYKKKQALTAAQVELKLPQHSLIADCETRVLSSMRCSEPLSKYRQSEGSCPKTGKRATWYQHGRTWTSSTVLSKPWSRLLISQICCQVLCSH